MKRFEIRFADGHSEQIDADGFDPNGWCVAFFNEDERQSKAWNAKPGQTVIDRHVFRVIAARLVDEVRQTSP